MTELINSLKTFASSTTASTTNALTEAGRRHSLISRKLISYMSLPNKNTNKIVGFLYFPITHSIYIQRFSLASRNLFINSVSPRKRAEALYKT